MEQGKPDETRPAPVQMRVTWSLVWSLWWRWMVFSIAATVIVWVIIIFFLYGPF